MLLLRPRARHCWSDTCKLSLCTAWTLAMDSPHTSITPWKRMHRHRTFFCNTIIKTIIYKWLFYHKNREQQQFLHKRFHIFKHRFSKYQIHIGYDVSTVCWSVTNIPFPPPFFLNKHHLQIETTVDTSVKLTRVCDGGYHRTTINSNRQIASNRSWLPFTGNCSKDFAKLKNETKLN